jgi:hypothetical protein
VTDAAAPVLLHQLRSDWGAVQAASQKRVIHSAAASWTLWSTFCHSIGVDTEALPQDPIPILQIFAQRLRTGTLAPGRGTVKSRSVEDTIRGEGQTYAGLGTTNPRVNTPGQVETSASHPCIGHGPMQILPHLESSLCHRRFSRRW